MIVCATCSVIMRPKKTGEMFVEMTGADPYKLWSGDLLECPNCHKGVLLTIPTQQPISQLGQPDFHDKIDLYHPHFWVT